MLTKKQIISKKDFAKRLTIYALFCFLAIAVSLAIGIFGYRYFGGLSWVDSFYNASMILTGMGPVNRLQTVEAKLFSSFYALFSGIAFLTTVAIFVSPIAHRIMSLLHVKDIED